MILRLSEATQVYVADKPADMRKAINGLGILVCDFFKTPAHDGSVYIFYNKDCTRVKCLFWDKNGFVLYHKRLDRGRFKFGKSHLYCYSITHQQLDWLLAGLDFLLMNEFPMLNFTHYF